MGAQTNSEGANASEQSPVLVTNANEAATRGSSSPPKTAISAELVATYSSRTQLLETVAKERDSDTPPTAGECHCCCEALRRSRRSYGIVADDAGSELGGDTYDSHAAAKQTLITHFVYMSLTLSLNHASVVACLSLSVSTLGSTVGNAADAALYISYTSTVR